MKLLRLDLVVAALLFLASIFLFWQTFSFSEPIIANAPGAAFFPRLILLGLGLCSAKVLWESVRSAMSSGRDIRAAGAPSYAAAMIGATVAYLVLLPYVGFELATAGYLFALSLGRLRNVRMAALISVLSVAALYLLFVRLINTDLPLLFLPR